MKTDDFNKLNSKAGFDVAKMKEAAENGKLDDFINQNLSSSASARLKQVLSSKEATEKLLSTPQAKELLKKFTKGE